MLDSFAKDVEKALNELEDSGYQTPGPMKIDEHGFVIIGRKLQMIEHPLLGVIPVPRPPEPKRRQRKAPQAQEFSLLSEHTETIVTLALTNTSRVESGADTEVIKAIVGGLEMPSEELKKVAEDCSVILSNHIDTQQHEDCTFTRVLNLLVTAISDKISLQMN